MRACLSVSLTPHFGDCFHGGWFVKRKTSDHAVLHDFESLPLSSDLKTFGQILKRPSRPTETLKNLPILASEKVCKYPTNVTSYLGQ
jgi:hypothetical protein